MGESKSVSMKITMSFNQSCAECPYVRYATSQESIGEQAEQYSYYCSLLGKEVTDDYIVQTAYNRKKFFDSVDGCPGFVPENQLLRKTLALFGGDARVDAYDAAHCNNPLIRDSHTIVGLRKQAQAFEDKVIAAEGGKQSTASEVRTVFARKKLANGTGIVALSAYFVYTGLESKYNNVWENGLAISSFSLMGLLGMQHIYNGLKEFGRIRNIKNQQSK